MSICYLIRDSHGYDTGLDFAFDSEEVAAAYCEVVNLSNKHRGYPYPYHYISFDLRSSFTQDDVENA
jgi:hypothetical protein